MTEQELAQLPLLSREIEQYQARLQGPDLDPVAYCQSVRHVVAEGGGAAGAPGGRA